jgi:hypothetical protein
MLSIKLAFLLATIFLAHAIHLQNNHDAAVDLPAGSVRLVADNGQFLKICHGCGNGAFPDSASIGASQSPEDTWTLELVGAQVAFKGSNGKYLSRCNTCWGGGSSSLPDSAFVHVADHKPYSLWTPVLQSNGKYSFLSDNGRFLARCENCVGGVSSPNLAFVHEANSANAWAQWDVAYTNLPKLGPVTIQADNGAYLKICSTCGGAYPNAAAVQAGITAESKWQLVRVGTKVAIKGSNGNFLSRCNSCWPSGSYPDSAFVHVPSASAPYSQWTAVKQGQGSGKWALQADTGKYLARCNHCAK